MPFYPYNVWKNHQKPAKIRSPGQNAGSEQSFFGLASDIATFFPDTDQDISDGFVPENSETQIALQQKPTFISVHSYDVSRPNVQVVLTDAHGAMWIIKISIVHFELQSHEDPIENDVQLLNHLTTVEPKKFDRKLKLI